MTQTYTKVPCKCGRLKASTSKQCRICKSKNTYSKVSRSIHNEKYTAKHNAKKHNDTNKEKV